MNKVPGKIYASTRHYDLGRGMKGYIVSYNGVDYWQYILWGQQLIAFEQIGK